VSLRVESSADEVLHAPIAFRLWRGGEVPKALEEARWSMVSVVCSGAEAMLATIESRTGESGVRLGLGLWGQPPGSFNAVVCEVDEGGG
jgi:hypothetical protein